MFGFKKKAIPLASLQVGVQDISDLKRKVDIAVIDDEPFSKKSALSTHGFRLIEIGPNPASIDQIQAYSIIICDIKGVGRNFGSNLEGAHVLSEIRKAFPDKYLIAFTGMTFDARYNASLACADVSLTKDAGTDNWVEVLEVALKAVTNPRERWIRFRDEILHRGAELGDVLDLEQAFIQAVSQRNDNLFKQATEKINIPPEIKQLALKFAIAGAEHLIDKVLAG